MASCSTLFLLISLVVMEVKVNGEIVNLDKQEQKRRHFEAFKTCRRMIESQPYPTKGLYCNRTWDRAMCWPDTPAGTTSSQPCADYLNGLDTSKNATRVCLPSGEWMIREETNATWSNYTACFSRKIHSSIDVRERRPVNREEGKPHEFRGMRVSGQTEDPGGIDLFAQENLNSAHDTKRWLKTYILLSLGFLLLLNV